MILCPSIFELSGVPEHWVILATPNPLYEILRTYNLNVHVIRYHNMRSQLYNPLVIIIIIIIITRKL